MFKSTAQRGFTLIELLVVIAIIGILAATVLASLGTARSSSQDAKIKQQLAAVRSEAELAASTNSGSYATICASAGVDRLEAGLSSTPVCNNAQGAWAMSADMTNGGHWCVDSTGASREISAGIGSATVCPAS